MVGRILLGSRSGVYGFWVSKAGVDVATAAQKDLLLDPRIKMLQAIWERRVVIPAYSHTSTEVVARQIVHPNFGFIPYLQISIVSDGYQDTISYPWLHGPAVSPRGYNRTNVDFYLRLRTNGTSTYTATVDLKLFASEDTTTATLTVPLDAYGSPVATMKLIADS